MNIEVGAKLCMVADGINSQRQAIRERRLPDHYDVTVTKVGRKFFYVVREHGVYKSEFKFHIEDNKQANSGGCWDYSLHSSWDSYSEQYNNKKATRELKNNYFDTSHTVNLTVDQCNRIISIIEEGK